MRNLTGFVVETKGKYWCDTVDRGDPDDGSPIVYSGETICWQDTDGTYQGFVTDNFKGRRGSKVEITNVVKV